jgi:PAS domain S-box-containing protein
LDALTVLHALASSPETASDALTLLHELQVHQVELDLQAEELQESRAELETALRRHTELYDFQPVGCFTIDSRLVMHELNFAAAGMLGIERDEAYGLGLDIFLVAESQRSLMELLSNFAAAGHERATCLLRLSPKGGVERWVRASIGADPAAQRYFVVLMDADGEVRSSPDGR